MSTHMRNEFMKFQKNGFDNASQIFHLITKRHPAYGMVPNDKVGVVLNSGEKITKQQLDLDMQQFADSYRAAKVSKVILFDTEQVAIFLNLIENRNFLPSIEYNLPFQDVWLGFTSPLDIAGYEGNKTISALLLSQVTVDKAQYDENTKAIQQADELFATESIYAPVDWSKSDTVTFNQARTIFQDLEVDMAMWTSQSESILTLDDCDPDMMTWKEKCRRLASACIQYINCENIYLEKQGEVPEAVNRKRESKGKSRLEPYYVCRIRGVNYDSIATGEGSKHSIRYDVRGHFRRMTTGKTIWVRPHQRGLTNELYIPKVYKVETGSKPEWKP
jgi:hypothetical protein